MKKSLIATILAGLFATSANAGIIIPAGDWTLDINGNVNAFANYTKAHGDNAITGGLATRPDSRGETKAMGINTGLLPCLCRLYRTIWRIRIMSVRCMKRGPV